jgi:hypothetical protein
VAPIGTEPPHEAPDLCAMAPYADPGPAWRPVGIADGGLSFEPLPDDTRHEAPLSPLVGRAFTIAFELDESGARMAARLWRRLDEQAARARRKKAARAARALRRAAAHIRRTTPNWKA